MTNTTSELITNYPHLTPRADFAGRGQVVTTNIRKHLKKCFTNIKFSVTYTDYSINIKWADGATEEQINKAIAIFYYADHNSQIDYFGTKSDDFTDMFGGFEYKQLSHSLSDKKTIEILERLNAHRDARQKISFKQYKNNELLHFIDSDDLDDSRLHFYSKFKEYKAAVLGGFITHGEIYKKINNTTTHENELVNDGMKLGLSAHCFVSYLFELQHENNDKNIKSQEENLKVRIIERRCELAGIETSAEQEKREYNELEAIKKAQRESIKPIKIEILKKPKTIGARIPAVNKNNTIEENNKFINEKSYLCNYELYKIVTLSEDDFAIASNNLIMCCDLWNNRDKPESCFQNESEIHWPCVKFINEKTAETFLVDTQGYEYARYVGIEVDKFGNKVTQTKSQKDLPARQKNALDA